MKAKHVEVTKEVYKTNHDNAPPHRINDDPEIITVCTSDGWDARFSSTSDQTAPTATSLSWIFSTIQSLQDQTTPRTIDELIAEIGEAFDTQDASSTWSCLHELGRV